jgi:aldose 1-epimerase
VAQHPAQRGLADPALRAVGDAREDYVAFEPMTAPADALRTGDGLREVAPGKAFTAAWTLAVAAA